jgi:Tfp pilus assembly protein FimT
MVELLVVTGIMVILVGGAMVAVARFNAGQKVKAAKEQLISNLKLARNYAKGMQTPRGIGGNLKYVTVSVAANTTVTITGVTDTDRGDFLTKKINEGSEVSFSPIIGPDVLAFAAYENKLVDSSGNPLGVGMSIVVISAESSGTTEIVNISASGLINEK